MKTADLAGLPGVLHAVAELLRALPLPDLPPLRALDVRSGGDDAAPVVVVAALAAPASLYELLLWEQALPAPVVMRVRPTESGPTMRVQAVHDMGTVAVAIESRSAELWPDMRSSGPAWRAMGRDELLRTLRSLTDSRRVAS